MHRRAFIAATVATPAIIGLGSKTGSAQPAERTPVAVWRQFVITTKIILQTRPARHDFGCLWCRPQSAIRPPSMWTGRATAELNWCAIQLMARRCYVALGTKATPQHIEVRQTVATCDRAALPTVPISQAERQFWMAPTESAPTDGIVRTTVSVSLTVAPTPVSGCAPSMIGWWTRPGATLTRLAAVSATSRQCSRWVILAVSVSISTA